MKRLGLALALIALTALPVSAQIISYAAPLPVAAGGTGGTTLTTNGVLYGAGTGAIVATAQGPANSVLTANAGAPSFSANPTVTTLTTTGNLNVQGVISPNTAATPLLMSSNVGGSLGQWRLDTNGNLTPSVDVVYQLGTTALRPSTVFAGTAFRSGSAGAADVGAASEGMKRFYCDFTNTATVGAVTINKACGRVNIAAAGTSVVVTDSLVTAASHVACWASSSDATAQVKSCVPAAGSFTITTAATTGQTSFDFQVFSAD